MLIKVSIDKLKEGTTMQLSGDRYIYFNIDNFSKNPNYLQILYTEYRNNGAMSSIIDLPENYTDEWVNDLFSFAQGENICTGDGFIVSNEDFENGRRFNEWLTKHPELAGGYKNAKY